MVFLAGIDEAGYGPFVGPLTMGFSLWRLPQWELDLWAALARSTARKPGRQDRQRLWLDDSKKVHQGPHGRRRLERTVAAFRELVESDSDLPSWVGRPPGPAARDLHAAPWFKKLDGALCPSVEPARARLDAASLRRDLEACGADVVALGARAVPAGEWNRFLNHAGNKAAAHFEVCLEVLHHLLRLTGDAPLRIELDRHGGRQHYARLLMRALRPQRLLTHGESPQTSLYSLQFPHREVQLRFSEGADRRHVPTALASLAAKQTRERLMDLFNAWWAKQLPEVKGTKGYGVDGKRFLAEVEPQCQSLGLPPRLLRRDR